MPQAAGQVKILIFLVKIKIFPMYANIFCDAGQVPIYFEAWVILNKFSYFSTKIYAVGTQKNRLIETVLLSTHTCLY